MSTELRFDTAGGNNIPAVVITDATGAAVAMAASTPSTVSDVNSTSSNLAGAAVFTGTAVDVTGYSSITVAVFSSHASATDGLSIQQSSNGTNWDILDVYSIPAVTGKTFGVQAAAKWLRVVYTNGATLTTSLRIQTILHAVMPRTASARPQDARTNDNDFEESTSYGMLYNGTTWDRARGSVAGGAWSQGPAANGAAAVGNPVQVGGIVRTTSLAAGTAGNMLTASMSSGGALVVLPYSGPEVSWQYAAASGGIVNTTDVAVKAAAAAGLRNYITGFSCTNASATIATEIVIKDGSTVIWRGYVGAGTLLNSVVGVTFPTPLRGTAATAVNVAAITTGAQLYVNLQGFVAA